MATKEEIANKHYEWYTKSRDDTREWREQRDRCKKAYFGNQWDSGVAQRIRDRGQVDVVMNILRPLIRNRASTMIANKPTGKILGVKKKDIEDSQYIQDFMDWHWYNSIGQLRAERVVMGQQREGVGYFFVHLDPKADYGRGELKITDLSYRHVFIPKATREWDGDDAPYIQVSKLLTEEDFKAKNPRIKVGADYFQTDDEIRWPGQREHKEKDAIDLPEGMIDQNFIREIDTFEKVERKTRIFYIVPTQTIQVLKDDYELTLEDDELIKNGLIEERIVKIPRIKWTKTYGEKIWRHSEILPISFYPVIPVADEDTGNAMSLGEIDQTFGVQELANKAWSLVIQNAALSSSGKMVIDAGRAGVTDLEKKFREDWAPPGAIVNMKLDPQTGRFPYEMVKPEPLNQAFYTIFERLAQHIQFGMATFNSKLGDTSNAPNTFSATLQYGEWQQDNLRIPLSRLELGIQRVYDIILQWAPNHYTFFKMFDIMREDESVDQGSINEKQFDSAGNAVQTIKNDITKLRVKFRIRMGSTMPSQSVAYLSLYEKLAAINPLFMKYMVEYLPIKDKEKLIKELDIVAKLTEQTQQQQQELNTISGMLQNSLRQQSESEIRQDVREADLKLKEIISDQKIITNEMKSAQKQQTKNIQKQQKEKSK